MFQYFILLKMELEFYNPYCHCHQLCARQMDSVLYLSYPYSMVRAAEMTVCWVTTSFRVNPYPTAFPYGNGMVLHFYQQEESSTTKTVHKVINKGLKTYV